MKTTLALLIAGLFFLATPLLATAAGNHHDKGKPYKSWVNYDRADHHYYAQRGQQRVKTHPRENRREMHQMKTQFRHNPPRRYYIQQPAVLIGIPHLVFQFGW